MTTRLLLRWLTRHLPAPRIIGDDVTPYLSRWYLLGRPTMPDGSSPFDVYGTPRLGIVWNDAGFGLYLHRFHRGDGGLELHNHPWRWAVSLILAGGYVEERRVPSDLWTPKWSVERRTVRPWTLNRIAADDFHRVDLLEEDAWTLFLVGPKHQSWGFWSRTTDRFVGWRDFLSAKSGSS